MYVLFGTVIGKIDEPGLHFLWPLMGWKALIVNWLGKLLRARHAAGPGISPQPAGEFGRRRADGHRHLVRNVHQRSGRLTSSKTRDPRGSLAANVSNSTVRCLTNLPLAKMMVNRHGMSHTVRDEVSPKSHEWGYRLGSVYIRKVHFRDLEMIHQIESKVVNRLRQVTSAIKQDGANQVSIITSTAGARPPWNSPKQPPSGRNSWVRRCRRSARIPKRRCHVHHAGNAKTPPRQRPLDLGPAQWRPAEPLCWQQKIRLQSPRKHSRRDDAMLFSNR